MCTRMVVGLLARIRKQDEQGLDHQIRQQQLADGTDEDGWCDLVE